MKIGLDFGLNLGDKVDKSAAVNTQTGQTDHSSGVKTRSFTISKWVAGRVPPAEGGARAAGSAPCLGSGTRERVVEGEGRRVVRACMRGTLGQYCGAMAPNTDRGSLWPPHPPPMRTWL